MIVGCDVGNLGGLVVLDKDGNVIEMHTIPKNGKDTDYNALAEIFATFAERNFMVGLEEVHAIFGSAAKATFSFGYIYGFLNALCIANKIRYVQIPPKKWQKYIWTNGDIVLKLNKRVDTKATSLNAAGRLFPNQSFRATKRSTVAHDGLVDSALIAYYILKNY